MKSIFELNPTFKEIAELITEKFEFDNVDHLLGEGEDEFELDGFTVKLLPAYHFAGRYKDELHINGKNLHYLL